MSYNHAIYALAAGDLVLEAVGPVSLREINEARVRLADLSVPTPLIAWDDPESRVRLKLENLQTAGCFKIRPIGNAVLARPAASLADGIYTTSSGNSALGVAHMGRRLGIRATAVVPENAPEAKLARLRQLGARIDMRPAAAWWRAIETGTLPDLEGVYIDAVRDPASLAGDATIGVEILEAWPEVEAILVPFGGGGLACGIACAVRALAPAVKIVACELESAQPLAAAFRAGKPVEVAHAPGFVSGVGYGTVLPEMWPLIQSCVDEVVTVPLAEVARAIRDLALGAHVVAEGAGALAVAAARGGRYPGRNVCAVISGGNLDAQLLAAILGDPPLA
jgi:threonine dehydratase